MQKDPNIWYPLFRYWYLVWVICWNLSKVNYKFYNQFLTLFSCIEIVLGRKVQSWWLSASLPSSFSLWHYSPCPQHTDWSHKQNKSKYIPPSLLPPSSSSTSPLFFFLSLSPTLFLTHSLSHSLSLLPNTLTLLSSLSPLYLSIYLSESV